MIALNRKNALFAGGDEGGQHWAIHATIIECCKLHCVAPNAYLTDVLTRLVHGHQQSRLSELTPWAWKAAKGCSRRSSGYLVSEGLSPRWRP